MGQDETVLRDTPFGTSSHLTTLIVLGLDLIVSYC